MKDNKLIAEFMGSKTIRINVPFEYDLGEELPTSKNICNSIVDAMEEVQIEIDEGIINGCDLCMETPQYHTSWDLLMPVVDKIESFEDENRCAQYNVNMLQCWVEIIHNETSEEIVEAEGINKLQATYQAVVEFIKFYNQNK